MALAVCGDANDYVSLLSQVCAAAGLIIERADFTEAKLQIASRRPALVVTELRLGAYNGLHLAVHAAAACRRIPVIVLADAADQSLQDDAESLGAIFAVMPVTPKNLESIIDRALSTGSGAIAAVRAEPSVERRHGERRQHTVAWAADWERRSGRDRRATDVGRSARPSD